MLPDERPVEPQPEPRLTRGELAIAIVLWVGVVAVMLVAAAYKVFELDRYFVPKELVLNAAALVVAAILFGRKRKVRLDLVDSLLLVFIGWSIVSALFATNHWLAQRAVAVSVSSAIVFWGGRQVGKGRAHRIILAAASLATVAAAVTSLAQAYGMENDWFTFARAPGGTLGNRNFIAHVIAIGLPVTLWMTLTAKRSVVALIGSLGIGILSADLVLSRSRAAWLAVAAFIMVATIPFLASRKYWKGTDTGGRLARALLAAVLGGTIAVIIPNTLEWNSDNPYLESARKVVDYSSGSGRGRVAQYRNSLEIVAADPVFGAGPGNWAVRYPKFAPGGDKSLAESGMAANPWPSSDWVAFLSERGAIATIALAGVFAVIFFRSLRRWRDLDGHDAVLLRVALAATVVATMVVSAFDAVLLLPAPAFLAWLIFGAALGESKTGDERDFSESKWKALSLAVLFVAGLGVARSAAQTIAMMQVGNGGRTAEWVSGARWDPGSYRISQRVADTYANLGQCSKARQYAMRAVSLFPNSPPARRVARRCGIRL